MLGNRFIVDNLSAFYSLVGKELLGRGSQSSPRGQKTLEVIAPQIILTNPRMRLVYNKDRKYNILHALNEATLLFSQTDQVKHIAEFNKNMANFSDDGVTMYGSYGRRIAMFIPHIIHKLKRDVDSRQAVLNINDRIDLVTHTKDVPCTNSLQFMIRENKLHMITTMRSNDILFGFQYDVFMFTMLQEAIANSLGIDVGYYVHQPASLHVYEKYPVFNGYEMLEEMAKDSVPIGMINNNIVDEWLMFAKHHTSHLKGDVFFVDSTTTIDQVGRLFRRERVRQVELQLIEKGEQSRQVIDDTYREFFNVSPEWAKPFLGKWNK